MNIWDSVQKGLEKASNEAARIARIQRLRSQIDKLGRQIGTQEKDLLYKVMELYASGRLIQSELIPLCHELLQTDQQLKQAQGELQTIQSQQPPIPNSQATLPPPSSTNPYNTMGDSSAVTYPSYVEPTIAALTPPPPPNYTSEQSADTVMPTIPPPPPGATDLTIASQPTIMVGEPSQELVQKLVCQQCGAESQANFLFCQQCGTQLQTQQPDHLPTRRATTSSAVEDQATVRVQEPATIEEQATIRVEESTTDTSKSTLEKDRGN